MDYLNEILNDLDAINLKLSDADQFLKLSPGDQEIYNQARSSLLAATSQLKSISKW